MELSIFIVAKSLLSEMNEWTFLACSKCVGFNQDSENQLGQRELGQSCQHFSEVRVEVAFHTTQPWPKRLKDYVTG